MGRKCDDFCTQPPGNRNRQPLTAFESMLRVESSRHRERKFRQRSPPSKGRCGVRDGPSIWRSRARAHSRSSTGTVCARTPETERFRATGTGAFCDDAGRRLTGRQGIIRVPDGAAVASDGTIHKDGMLLDRLLLRPGTSVQSGFLESSNVNAIAEMVDLLGAQRSFESAQKVMSAIDAADQKASNEIARLK